MTAKRRIGPDQIVGVIPARWGSTRFPGKILTPIAGRPLLERILRGCTQSKRVQKWLVATDDHRIATVSEEYGVEAILTPKALKSGSDRIAHVMKRRKERWVVNWQGDEWLADGRPIDRLISTLESDSGVSVATLARPMDRKDASDRNRVKVVLSRTGRALYFSRALIPHEISGTRPVLLHLGAYAFERVALLRFAAWSRTPLERQESLEQLRLLEHDVPIAVAIFRARTHGVDTPSDARILEVQLKKSRSS